MITFFISFIFLYRSLLFFLSNNLFLLFFIFLNSYFIIYCYKYKYQPPSSQLLSEPPLSSMMSGGFTMMNIGAIAPRIYYLLSTDLPLLSIITDKDEVSQLFRKQKKSLNSTLSQ